MADAARPPSSSTPSTSAPRAAEEETPIDFAPVNIGGCEPRIIIAVDPTAVERRHLDVREAIETYMLTRIPEAVVRNCFLVVDSHVGYVCSPSPEATDRLYSPTPGSDSLRVQATTLMHSSCSFMPLRMRIAFEATDAGRSILQMWPLPPIGAGRH